MTKLSTSMLLAVLGVSSAPFTSATSLVGDLLPSAYMGRWFQVYSSATVKYTFELGAACVTADYALESSNKFSVLNANTKIYSPSGSFSSIRGYGIQLDPTNPGDLRVHLDGTPFDTAPYSVYKLGPVVDNLYDYAVVSDPSQGGLFVLARDVKEFNTKYDAEVLEYLKSNGWDHFYNSPRATYQGDDCKYITPSTTAAVNQFAVVAPSTVPALVSELDATRYIGRWYQMYSSATVKYTFEFGSACVTADYKIDNGSVGTTKFSVLNANTKDSDHAGAINTIAGYGVQPDPANPGALKVHLEGVPLDQLPYSVYKLGPVVNNQYSYAIVSDPSQGGLFVLARDVKEFNTKYDAEVLEYLKSNGWDHFYNSPRATYQGDDCKYITPSTTAAVKAVVNAAVSESPAPISSVHDLYRDIQFPLAAAFVMIGALVIIVTVTKGRKVNALTPNIRYNVDNVIVTATGLEYQQLV